jgi:hypothetical protein
MTKSLAFLGNYQKHSHSLLIKRQQHYKPMIRNSVSLNMVISPLPLHGIDIGMPLNIIDNVFTNLHYGYDVTTLKVVLLQFLIGYYTYGKDRYKDAVEYIEQHQEDGLDANISEKKKDLYKTLYNNSSFYKTSYCVAFYCILFLLFYDDYWYLNIPTAGLLYSTEYYKQLKGQIVGFKPVFVASMWTFSAVLLPCILHDHDYSIFSDVDDYLPCFLVLFACTNLADIKDIDEDIENGVNTIPVVFGKENTQMLVMVSLIFSSLIFGIHPNYMDRPLVNGAFELQNAVLSFLTFLI